MQWRPKCALLRTSEIEERLSALYARKGDVLYQGTVFPLLKADKTFYIPKAEPDAPFEKDFDFPEEEFSFELYQSHPSDHTSMKNIRHLRGEKISSSVPGC